MVLKDLARPTVCRSSEVYDLNGNTPGGFLLRPGLKNDILRLQVSVHDALLVEVIHRTHNLGHDVGYIPLSELLDTPYILQQLPPIAILGDDVVRTLVLKHVVQFNYVGVVYLTQNVQLGK